MYHKRRYVRALLGFGRALLLCKRIYDATTRPIKPPKAASGHPETLYHKIFFEAKVLDQSEGKGICFSAGEPARPKSLISPVVTALFPQSSQAYKYFFGFFQNKHCKSGE